jgi:ribonuclease P protein component
VQERIGEKGIPTEPYSAEKNAWVQEADVDQGRPLGFETEKGQGSQTAGRPNEGLLISIVQGGRTPAMAGFFTFPKKERIRRRAEFLRIFRQGTKFRTAHFRISSLPNGRTHPRLGIAVGKKAGSAVVRNRLKRRIREFYRQNKGLFPAGRDWVIAAGEDAGLLDFRQVADELKGVLRER